MNKPFLTLTLTLLCTASPGQGWVRFDINSDDLIYFTTDKSWLYYEDANRSVGGYPLAGSSLYTGPAFDRVSPGTIMSLAGSPTFVAALYAGTSAGSMSLLTTTTIDDIYYDANPGGIVPVNVSTPWPPGTRAYFQVQVFDSRCDANYPCGGAAYAWTTGSAYGSFYAGVSQLFQATPGVVPEVIYSPLPPFSSTWAAGTFPVVDVNAEWGPGFYGGITVASVPMDNPPFIWMQPQSTTNFWGQSIRFAVGAGGDPYRFHYQWQSNGTDLVDSAHISGSASNTLTVNSITLADACDYRVVITNNSGRITSDVATLTVILIPPAITNVAPEPDGSLTLDLTGTPYTTNRLWATASLTPPTSWAPISTNIASSTGTWQVTDTEAAAWTTRFYRASMP